MNRVKSFRSDKSEHEQNQIGEWKGKSEEMNESEEMNQSELKLRIV